MDKRFYYTDLFSLYLDLAPRGLENLVKLGAAFTDLTSRYSKRGRYYHNLDHIIYGYYKHRSVMGGDLAPAEFFAWLYHDSVYDSESSTNEEDSAEYFRRDNYLIGLPLTQEVEVIKLIMSTKHDREKNLITDIDLCGIGDTPEIFDINNASIRKEYIWASVEQWKEGRLRFIEAFLATPRIFHTEKFFEAFEAPARENLDRERRNLCG